MEKQKKLEIKFLHDCLLIKNILVIGDLHIGYEEQFHGKAIFPRAQLEEIIEKLKEIFDYLEKEKIGVKKIVILGDVKHYFGEPTKVEWRETLEFFDFLESKIFYKEKMHKKNAKTHNIIVIKGNHDNILKPILRKRNIKLKNYYCVKIKEGKENKKICFLHGNKLFKQCLDNQTAVLIFGHLHPAITLYDGYKNEKYKCFLRGGWKINMRLKRKLVYILPSFSSVSFGYDLNDIDNFSSSYSVNKGKFFVIPNKDLKNFGVIIYNNKEKKEYNFGFLKKLINKNIVR